MTAAAELPTLDLPGAWETVLDGDARQELEQAVLPQFLRGQRWFGGKARQVTGARVVDWGSAGPGRALLTLVEVTFADGAGDLYFVPLAATPGPAAAALLESMRSRVLARLWGPDGEALLHDALADDTACAALLDAIASGREFPTRAGRIRAFTTAAFRELRGPADQPLPPRRGPETSSNSLVFYGDRLLLKLFRRLEVGTNPDLEIGRYLTEHTDFTRIPRVAGAVEYDRPGSGPVTLATLQAFVPSEGDGWRLMLNELERYYDRAERGVHGPGAGGRPVTYMGAAATLGRRTAELHLALAKDTGDPAFTPEAMTAADVATLAAEVRERGDQALAGVRAHRADLPEAVRPAADQFLAEGPAVHDRLAGDPGIRPGALKIRCHGDYHLAQVLWVDSDFVILDFEGEPTRTVEKRCAKQSPLKDVAGMLRSFNYAAYAGLFAFTQGRPDDFARLEAWAALWQDCTSAAFLRAYGATAAGAPFLPADTQFGALLDFFMLDKAFYELLYELNNRPDWVRIPLRGVLSLVAARSSTKG
jgi:maltose alpha-D-glucosyltransferase/alpha-amylase